MNSSRRPAPLFDTVSRAPTMRTAGDFINLPLFETFTSSHRYYGTLAHELIHWTGAEKQLNRTFGKRFGNSTYAAEELVAELGSAFVCAEFGIDCEEPKRCLFGDLD